MKSKKKQSPIGSILSSLLVGLLITGFGGLAHDARADAVSHEFAHALPAVADACEDIKKEALAENGEFAYKKRQAPAKKGNTRVLLLGGMSFGTRLITDGVLVVGFGESGTDGKTTAAYRAGLRLSDAIVSVNGKKMLSASDVAEAVKASGGKPLSFVCRRKGECHTFSVTPDATDNGYRIGTWLRDSSAGIGTVTFIDPQTLAFGGLGHGICEAGTGELLPVLRGSITDAVITGITRGAPGSPGEMKGHLGKQKRGTLLTNTECGLFGFLSSVPEGCRLITAAKPSEVRTGEATIITSLDNGAPTEYKIRITAIGEKDSKTKSFSIRVEDERLIEKTGGIVQGMSGSPIIQNGKLIGAVTHVLVGDPTAGYGIFIENMLNASSSARNELPKSA